MMREICLKPIDESNILSAFALELAEEQKAFVSHPMRSLALGYVYPDRCRAFGVYGGEKMTGYVMLRRDPDENTHTLWHFMIDKNYQGQGYGKAALSAALDKIRSGALGDSEKVILTCNPLNKAALDLYHAFGFCETGRTEGIEIELELKL